MYRFNRYFKTAVVGAASLLLFVGTASAQMVTQTHMTAAQTLDFSDNFMILPFDTNLGTLTCVEVQLAVDVRADLLVSNLNATSQNFTNASASVPITVTGPTSDTNVNLMETATASVASGTVAGHGFNSYPGLTLSDSGSLSVDPSDFAFWETSPLNLSVDFSAGTDGTYTGQSGLRVLFGGDASGDATTTVTYTYTPSSTTTMAPEPATTGLITLALGVLIFGRMIVLARARQVRRASGKGLPSRS